PFPSTTLFRSRPRRSSLSASAGPIPLNTVSGVRSSCNVMVSSSPALIGGVANRAQANRVAENFHCPRAWEAGAPGNRHGGGGDRRTAWFGDRKSTRLNSSPVKTSYAVFCLKKKHKRP